MKIRAIIPNNEGHASSFWRIVRPFKLLSNTDDVTWHNHDQLENVDFENALVIIHRIIPANPAEYIEDLRKKGAKYIAYSIDDLTVDEKALLTYLATSGGMTSTTIDEIVDRIPKQLETINLCDELIVSTYELAILVADKINKSICVLNNAIDVDWYTDRLLRPAEYQNDDDKVYIGWAGGRRPESDLVHMAKAWRRIHETYDNVWFVVAGWQPDIIDRNIDLNRKIRIPWVSLDDWPRSMQVDIGCCPLAETKFNEGKSPIKFFEYTLAGAATVVSPTIYEHTVVDRVDSLVAYGQDSWYLHLSMLIEHKSSRDRMQVVAEYGVRKHHSLETSLEGWRYHFQRMLE